MWDTDALFFSNTFISILYRENSRNAIIRDAKIYNYIFQFLDLGVSAASLFLCRERSNKNEIEMWFTSEIYSIHLEGEEYEAWDNVRYNYLKN